LSDVASTLIYAPNIATLKTAEINRYPLMFIPPLSGRENVSINTNNIVAPVRI